MSPEHQPLAVAGYDGMTFVRCSCPRADGVKAVNGLIRAASDPQRTFTADEVIEIANETSDSFGNLYRLDFIDRIRHEATIATAHGTTGAVQEDA